MFNDENVVDYIESNFNEDLRKDIIISIEAEISDRCYAALKTVGSGDTRLVDSVVAILRNYLPQWFGVSWPDLAQAYIDSVSDDMGYRASRNQFHSYWGG